MSRLEGKIILITGAAQGYGKSLANACGAEGATVILVDKSIKKLEQQYDFMLEQGCPTPAMLPLNLAGADANDFDTVINAVKETFSKLDALILNATEFQGLTPLRNFNPERWYSMMQVNLNANFHLVQMFAQLLEASGSGKVIYVHDEVVERKEAYWGAYAVTKAAMKSMIELYQIETADNDAMSFHIASPEPMATAIRQRISPAGQASGAAPESQVLQVLQYL
jgi:NAD(P)-dependent dehydrogenase (short-subunit alcohol dehydrogenase family)